MEKNIITIIFSLFVLTGYAQPSVFEQFERLSISNNQQFIEDAVKTGLFIIHQEYKLQDVEAKKTYGLDGKNYFGETYSLGVKMTGGYYISDKVVHPWNYDSNFDKYRNDPKYAPIIAAREYKSLKDSTYSLLPIDEKSLKDSLENSFIRIENNTIFEDKGFQTDTCSGKKEGWLVWVVTSEPVAKNPDAPISLVSYRKELVIEVEKENYEIENPSFNKEITGGIYIVPEITQIGQITFQLAGFLQFENNKWKVIKIVENPTIEKSNPKNELTPLKEEANKDDKKKNERKNK